MNTKKRRLALKTIRRRLAPPRTRKGQNPRFSVIPQAQPGDVNQYGRMSTTATRAVRAVAAATVSIGVATALLTAPAEASTHLPKCNAPEGQVCLAIDNKSDQASYKINSILSPDGKWCMNYNPGWGPGDTVGWPDIFVNPDFADNPSLRVFSDTSCSAPVENVSVSTRPQGKNQDGYAVIGVGPHFVLFSNRLPRTTLWCVTALNEDSNEISGDCDKVELNGTSTFWVPEQATKILYEIRPYPSDIDIGADTLENYKDWCYRQTAGGTTHEATEQPCTRD